MDDRRIVGTETQAYEERGRYGGIERVIRILHSGLHDCLSAQGAQLAPFHTRPRPRHDAVVRDPYLASDPIYGIRLARLEELSAIFLLDLNPFIDFRAIRQRRLEADVPVVSMVYDVLPIIYPHWWPPTSQRHFRVFIQQLFYVSDLIVVTSEKVRQDLLNLGWTFDGEIHVVPLGSHFAPQLPAKKEDGCISLLYVSTVAPRKGHELLLRAFDILDAEGLDVSLTIIGAAGWDPPLCDRVRGHREMGGRVKWISDANDEQIRAHVRKSTLGVFPSEDEGFGLFLEEALSLGLPVVVTDIPVFRERAQANMYFAEATAEGLAQTILDAHLSPWKVPETPVRSMKDFVADFLQTVMPVVEQHS
jgi:glycosyltransferase involved in cell wall biosynthesis